MRYGTIVRDPMNNYKLSWATYRRLRNQMLIVGFASAPLFIAVLLISPTQAIINDSWGWHLVWSAVSLCWFVLFLFLYLRLRNWPCPRCGKSFYSYSERHSIGPFTKHCGHCGLKKYSNEESTEA